MTVHTVLLEEQGLSRPETQPYRVVRVDGARCEHEVRRGNLIRQCRREPSVVIDGRKRCTIHARMIRGYE